MDNSLQLQEYIKNTIAANHTGIDQYVYGNWDRLLNEVSTTESNTIIFQEWPKANLSDNSGTYEVSYETTLYLLRYVDYEEWEQQNQTLSDILLIITKDILPRMRTDAHNNDDYFRISDTKTIEPVTFSTVNGLIGYEFTITYKHWEAVEGDNVSSWTDRS